MSKRGGDAALAARAVPATLIGWQRVALRGGRYPTLRRRRAGSVQGALVRLPARALARLAAYEGPAYRLTRVVVRSGNRNTAADAWIAAAATRRPWQATGS